MERQCKCVDLRKYKETTGPPKFKFYHIDEVERMAMEQATGANVVPVNFIKKERK